MSPAKKGKARGNANAEASSVSAEVSEASDRSKRGRGRKPIVEKSEEKEVKRMENNLENSDSDENSNQNGNSKKDESVTEDRKESNDIEMAVSESNDEEIKVDENKTNDTSNDESEEQMEVIEGPEKEDETNNNEDESCSSAEEKVETENKTSEANDVIEESSDELVQTNANKGKTAARGAKKAASKATESKAASKAKESKAASRAKESKAASKAKESKAASKAKESKATESKAASKATESKAASKATESKAASKATESKAASKAKESKAASKATESKAASKALENKAASKAPERKTANKSNKKKEAEEKDEEESEQEESEKVVRGRRNQAAEENGNTNTRQSRRKKEDENKKSEKKEGVRKRKPSAHESNGVKKSKICLEVPSSALTYDTPGNILALGQGDVGQLGLGADIMEKSRPAKVNIKVNNTRFIQVCAGGMHSLGVTSDGKIYSFGCNDEATLGRVTSNEDDCFLPGKVVGIDAKVVQVSAGDSHSAALTAQGQVYIWGTFRDNNGTIGINPGEEEMEVEGEKKKNGKEMGKNEKITMPAKILQGVKVVKIASGYAHVLCLSNKGEIYSLGASDVGQLGRVAEYFSVRGGRRGLNNTLDAKLVRFRKRGLKCVDIWATGFGSFAKSAEGEIYSWGLNNYFQLGFPDMKTRFTPELVTAFDPALDWKEIAGADHHLLALDESGKVYSLGRKEYGRLGLGTENLDHLSIPTLIEALASKKCITISCGTSVSYAVAEEGTIFCWGMGSNKQLGRGNDEDDVYLPVPMGGEAVKAVKGIRVGAGGQHVLLLVTEKS